MPRVAHACLVMLGCAWRTLAASSLSRGPHVRASCVRTRALHRSSPVATRQRARMFSHCGWRAVAKSWPRAASCCFSAVASTTRCTASSHCNLPGGWPFQPMRGGTAEHPRASTDIAPARQDLGDPMARLSGGEMCGVVSPSARRHHAPPTPHPPGRWLLDSDGGLLWKRSRDPCRVGRGIFPISNEDLRNSVTLSTAPNSQDRL